MREQSQDSIQAVTGWFGNLATSVVEKIDEVSHIADNNSAPKAASQPPARVARQRSEHEQRAYELKVSYTHWRLCVLRRWRCCRHMLQTQQLVAGRITRPEACSSPYYTYCYCCYERCGGGDCGGGDCGCRWLCEVLQQEAVQQQQLMLSESSAASAYWWMRE